jgi:two-component system response regulator MprA
MNVPLVVLIDDDQSWAEAAASLLREEGYQVLTAEDVRLGCELLERTAPGLVILDVELPQVGGLEILRTLRQAGSRFPVLMVSANDQAAFIAEAMGEGASGFLRKPVAGPLLLRAIRQLLPASPQLDGALAP